MTNPVHIAETALLLLAAYLVGCVLGYAARRILHAGRGTHRSKAPLVAPAPVQPPRPRSTAARLAASVDNEPLPVIAPKSTGARPVALDAPRNGGPDNLKQIKGIGPKIEASLHGLGIYHLDQIAGWNKANVDWVETRLAFKGRVRRERWVAQAEELGKLKASA